MLTNLRNYPKLAEQKVTKLLFADRRLQKIKERDNILYLCFFLLI